MICLKHIMVLMTVCLLNACSTTTVTQTAHPAVLLQASSEARQSINQAISVALNGVKVNVAKKAFVIESQLTLQQSASNPQKHKGLNGRLLGRPVLYHFSMVKQADTCYLVHDRTNKHYQLHRTQCRVL